MEEAFTVVCARVIFGAGALAGKKAPPDVLQKVKKVVPVAEPVQAAWYAAFDEQRLAVT